MLRHNLGERWLVQGFQLLAHIYANVIEIISVNCMNEALNVNVAWVG